MTRPIVLFTALFASLALSGDALAAGLHLPVETELGLVVDPGEDHVVDAGVGLAAVRLTDPLGLEHMVFVDADLDLVLGASVTLPAGHWDEVELLFDADLSMTTEGELGLLDLSTFVVDEGLVDAGALDAGMDVGVLDLEGPLPMIATLLD